MSTTSPRKITEAAAAILEARPIWIPPRPTALERAVGIGSGVGAAFVSPLLEQLIMRALSPLATDPERFEPEPHEMGDPGWFGPDSVAWRVHADPSLLIAGIAAFTFQALEPRAMAGVAEHSSFSVDFMHRARRTADFVQCVVYGSSTEAEKTCGMVRRMHDRVVGTTPDGVPYAANDPDLLDWVHIAEYATIVAANRRFSTNPLTLDEMDTYIGEVARVAIELGAPTPPTNWLELNEAIERHRPNLAVAEYAAHAIGYLERPPFIPDAAQALWQPIWHGAIASIPPIARDLLRLPEPTPVQLAATRSVLRVLGSLGNEPPRMAAAKRRLA